MNYRELRQEGVRILREHGVPDPEFDARELLFYAAGMDYSTYILKESCPADAIETAYRSLIKRRADRVPLQHLTGVQDFMGYEFLVSKDVLIPRQDTESLVIEAEKDLLSRTGRVRILDLCTGSGCIILSLYLRNRDKVGELCPEASDLSKKALSIARENAKRLGAEGKICFHQGDLFDFCDQTVSKNYDIIVSNPPYIPSDVIPGLMPEVRLGDPKLALDGGADGLSIYRRLIPGAYERLNDLGSLFLEIGFDQAESVTRLMEDAGFTDIRTVQDLAGNDRVVLGKKEMR